MAHGEATAAAMVVDGEATVTVDTGAAEKCPEGPVDSGAAAVGAEVHPTKKFFSTKWKKSCLLSDKLPKTMFPLSCTL